MRFPPSTLYQTTLMQEYPDGKNILHLVALEKNFPLNILDNSDPAIIDGFLRAYDNYAKTPIHYAIESGNTNFIRNFLGNPPRVSFLVPFISSNSFSPDAHSPDPISSYRNNALHYAIFFNPNLIDFLIDEYPAMTSEFNSQGDTPAGLAYYRYRQGLLDFDIVRKFINKDPNQSFQDYSGRQGQSLLEMAISNKDYNLCNLILDSEKFDINLHPLVLNSLVKTLADNKAGSNFNGISVIFKKILDKATDKVAVLNQLKNEQSVIQTLAQESSAYVNLPKRDQFEYYPPRDKVLTEIKKDEIKKIFKICIQNGVLPQDSFFRGTAIQTIYQSARSEMSQPSSEPSSSSISNLDPRSLKDFSQKDKA